MTGRGPADQHGEMAPREQRGVDQADRGHAHDRSAAAPLHDALFYLATTPAVTGETIVVDGGLAALGPKP